MRPPPAFTLCNTSHDVPRQYSYITFMSFGIVCYKRKCTSHHLEENIFVSPSTTSVYYSTHIPTSTAQLAAFETVSTKFCRLLYQTSTSSCLPDSTIRSPALTKRPTAYSPAPSRASKATAAPAFRASATPLYVPQNYNLSVVFQPYLTLIQAQTDTRTETGKSTNQSHAKGGGDASIVPQVLQEKLPESVERAVPNALHDTGDQDGLHRKQA